MLSYTHYHGHRQLALPWRMGLFTRRFTALGRVEAYFQSASDLTLLNAPNLDNDPKEVDRITCTI